MTGFHNVRFPDAIARGATGGPEYSTDIVSVASGFEQRNVNWSAARARYDIGTGIRTREQMAEVISFFRARKGRAYGFRFRDWTDFETTGQAMLATASSTVWQLVRRYPSGPVEDVRAVTKPEAGSIVVRVSGAVVAGLTIDHLTGPRDVPVRACGPALRRLPLRRALPFRYRPPAGGRDRLPPPAGLIDRHRRDPDLT